jgi:predicted acetyltransferase
MAEFAGEGRGGSQDNSRVGRDLRERRLAWESVEGFAAYVEALHADMLDEAPRPVGYVPSTEFWYVDGDEYLGRIALRHQLNEILREVGGHIGYDVRPTARRRGYATAMLHRVLPHAKARGIDPALITCDVDNVGSRKVIESAGGALEDIRHGKRRYWVPTT